MSKQLTPERAAKLARRCRGSADKPLGFFARRAWKRLDDSASLPDGVALEAIRGIAADEAHRCSGLARELIAETWFTSRRADLIPVIQESGAVARRGPARFASAAVAGRLPEVWTESDGPALLALFDDPEPLVSEGVLSEVLRVVGDAEDPRTPVAKDLLAQRWCSTRFGALRQQVIDHQAIAWSGYPRLASAALCGRLALVWTDVTQESVRALMNDADEMVNASFEAYVRAATGPQLQSLWAVALRWIQDPKDAQWWRQPLVSRLIEGEAPPAQTIIDGLWAAWLTTPDPALGASLTRWQVATASTHADADAASLIMTGLASPQRQVRTSGLHSLCCRLDHPVSSWALKYLVASGHGAVDEFCQLAIQDEFALAACIQERLAPKEPTARAVFFLLTGQIEQYRAFDLDGALLNLAYASATDEERARLLEAMRRAGGLDLIRILVGADRRERIPSMTKEEIDYLAGTLAMRNEWGRLWNMVLDVPVTTATTLMRNFDETKWTPRDDDERELFTMYRAMRGNTLDVAIGEVRESWPMGVHQARIHFLGRVNDISFAPDAMTLAVAGTQQVAGLINLTTGRLTHRFDGFSSSVGRVLHVGGGSFIAGERTNSPYNTCRVHLCYAESRAGRGSQSTIEQVVGSITSLTRRGERGFVAGTRSGTILVSDSLAERPRSISVAALGLDPESEWPREVASSRASGQIAILGRELVVTNAELTAIHARGRSDKVIQRAVFTPDDGLAVASGQGVITLMRRVGNQLSATYYREMQGLGGIAAINSRQQVVVANREGGRVYFYAANNLDHIGQLSSSKWSDVATSVHVSDSGDLMAVGFADGFTDVYDLRSSAVPALLTRPLVNMVPTDIARLEVGLRADLTAPVKQTLELIRASLLHRFRFDIELVDAAILKTGEYDISLA